MATCIRCEDKVPLGSQADCRRAPDGGCHEFLPHPFKPGRLDGLCAEPDPDFGTSCGHERDTEHDPYEPTSVQHFPGGDLMAQDEREQGVRSCSGCGGDIIRDRKGRWTATWYPVLDAYACPHTASGAHEHHLRAGDGRD